VSRARTPKQSGEGRLTSLLDLTMFRPLREPAT
jgi:hypothetical protein